MKDLINGHTNYYDLGYRLNRKYWGQGISSEAANASLSYAFNNLKIPEIIATVHSANAASNKVVIKLGFKLVETFYLHDLKHYWYEINEDNWTGLRC